MSMSNSEPSYQDKKAKLAAARKALLAKKLAKAKQASAADADQIPRRDGEGPLPLSYAQQRFWFMHQLDPHNPAYNMHEAWDVNGSLDVPALMGAINRVVARHAALRTIITLRDDVPYMQVLPELRLDLPVYAIEANPNDPKAQSDLYAISLKKAQAEARALFDLETGPLIRFSLLRLGPERHFLLLTMHHIISDEYSIGLIWSELNHFYALETGQTPTHTLPALPIQYDDYADWQSGQTQAEQEAKDLAYWEQQLAGEPPVTALPTDFVRPAQRSFDGRFARRHIPQLAETLRALAQATGTTPFMGALALFQTLLHRYSGEEEVWVGTPIANRDRPEVKQLFGLFLNTVVMRGRFDLSGGATTFKTLLQQVRQTTLEAFAHQAVPFEQVVDKLHVRRDPATNPLFQVMLVYGERDADRDKNRLPGLSFRPVPIDGGVSKFDLTLFVTLNESGIDLGLEYSSALFRPETAERILGHYETLLTAALADPERPIGELPLLTESERAEVLGEWRATPGRPIPNQTLDQLIFERAAAYPAKAAVCTHDQDGNPQALSYGELDRYSAELAEQLRQRGVGTGSYVGLFTERSGEMIIGILAILRAGGSYVPIDPDYPAERQRYILDDARPVVVLATENVALAPDLSAPVLKFAVTDHQLTVNNHPASDSDLQARSNSALIPQPSDLAYVIYTSGSTGHPKGVMVSHANIVHSTLAREEFYPEPVTRFLLLSSFAFDSSMVGIFWTLATGGALILPKPGMQQDLLHIAELIEHYPTSHLLALPLLYQLLLNETADRPAALESLRCVIVAGEACHADLVQTHVGRYPNCALYNEYGPTEGTVWSHAYRFPLDFDQLSVPIGKPIPRVGQLVVDRYGQPVPVGIDGELLISGAGITAGYLNRPELSAEKFIHSPLYPDEPFYRTGDLVRWLPDGNLLFVGRTDHQVKLRGFRIELGEIDATLTGHANIESAVTLVIDAQNGANEISVERQNGNNRNRTVEKRLVAWYVATQPIAAAELRRTVLAQLPGYMVPAGFVHLETMPLTPNGKINRKGLHLPSADAIAVDEQPYTPPSHPTEVTLAAIWAEVLQSEPISVHANFFDLGGDSIASIQIIAKAKRAGLNLSPQDIFEHQTIAALAQAIEDHPAWKQREAERGPSDSADFIQADDEAFDLIDLDDGDFDQLADLLGT